ncbi:MAG: UbiX family flavin prenyltransferase [Bacillota bacterium]
MVGISGASGVIYGIRILEALRAVGVETHLVISPWAEKNIELETETPVDEVRSLADRVYDYHDLQGAIASGSFVTAGMVIAPCSMKTLSAVANSHNGSLLTRAADVCLKERRKLVLLVRETPLHLGHLRLMAGVTEMGGVVMPPVPAFYHRPKTIDDIVHQTVGKVLDQFGLELKDQGRWRWGG